MTGFDTSRHARRGGPPRMQPAMSDIIAVTPFQVRVTVRLSDLDPQLHVNGAAYVQFTDHARFACVEAAGVSVEALLADRFGPVNLETTIRYHHELRIGDTVDVTCSWIWGAGRTYRVTHELRLPNGTLAAEVEQLSGMLDLETRRLIADPAEQWRSRATAPELLGL